MINACTIVMSTAYIWFSNISEKRNRDRKLDSAERRREWTEKFGATSRSSDRVIGPRSMPSNVDFGLWILHWKLYPLLYSCNSSKDNCIKKWQTDSFHIASFCISADRERAREKETVARSPDENDKTELLKEAEPIDYTGELSSAADTDFSQGYQRSSTLRSNRFGSRTSNAPPRGIFDDVWWTNKWKI